MKTFRQYLEERALEEGKKVAYAAHNDFGSPAQKVLARRSGSSAGGSASGLDEDKDKMKLPAGYGKILPKPDVKTRKIIKKSNMHDRAKKSGMNVPKGYGDIVTYDDKLNEGNRENKAKKNQVIRDIGKKANDKDSLMRKILRPRTPNLIRGREETQSLDEGNPLATMHKHQEAGRHFIAISTERPGLSKKEIAARNKDLVSSARAAGFGVRKAEGRYEGSRESSHIIHAKAPGREAGAELVAFGRKMGKKNDQDSILHHNGKTARLIGTNETGFPGKGNSEKVGTKLKYNDKESPFQTELRPSKKKAPARFTTE